MFFLFITILLASSLWAQTTSVSLMDVFGILRDVAKSTTDIYTYPATGLKILVLIVVCFKQLSQGNLLPTWTITRRLRFNNCC